MSPTFRVAYRIALACVIYGAALPISATSFAAECCRVCSSSQPCGNTCISNSKKCHKPRGCACTPEEAEEASLPLGFLLASGTVPEKVRQTVMVLDGDTFDLDGERIRLEGIDAPEIEQICNRASGEPYACGVRATAALKRLLKSGPVACRKDGEDRYGRTLAHCTAGETDINREMILRGWALAFLKYSTEYVEDEKRARAAGLGLWKGTLDAPWDWRKAH